MMRPCSNKSRRGSATVEMALVAPLVFMLIFAAIEFGRLLMAIHGMEEAAREGCRVAVLKDSTTNSVTQTVNNRLATFGISQSQLTITPNPPGNAEQWDPVSVNISVTYENVSWLPTSQYLKGKTISVTSTLPREAAK